MSLPLRQRLLSAWRLPAVLLWAVAAAVAAGGCARFEQAPSAVPALAFDPVVYPATRAGAGGGEGVYPGDGVFGVLACRYPASLGPADGVTVADGVPVRLSSGSWRPDVPVFWGGPDTRTAVLAYSPYGAPARLSLEEGVVFEHVDTALSQDDLLYTPLLEGLVPGWDGVVELPFRHALSRVEAVFRTNGPLDGVRVEVLSVWLASVAARGRFASRPAPSWTPEGDCGWAGLFTGLEEAGVNPLALPGGLWVIPQEVRTVAGALLSLTGSDGSVRRVSVTTAPFRRSLEPGRSYAVALSYDVARGALSIDEIHRSSL